MLSSSCNDGAFESPVDGDKEPTINSTSASANAGSLIMASSEEAAGRSDETRVSGNIDEENRSVDASGGENQPSSSVSNSKNDGKVDNKKNKSIVEDYNSILSAFDEFAAENKGESVGHGYKIGDMVWGKVKSHPWWPGHIYNEALASPSVRRSKTEGHVLVAFFGDSSYGWFDPAELIPFEENFADKSRQTNLRSFTKAVEEALDELSRRSSLGLACRCRNQFNFWPSNVDGYFVVDVGDYERGIYGLSQINKARNDFRPKELLSFIHQLALAPMNFQHSSIDFIKDKATVLACRKAMFEEFDETYAQAFGTIPVRPSRPTAPVAIDPSKAPLRGRLVIAEALSKGKTFVKPTKTKDQMEKDKYLFKRRDEPIKTKSKKANSGFSEKHHTSESGVTDYQNQASMAGDIRPIERVNKKAKVQKRPAGELSAENAKLIEKRKKKKRDIMSETGEQLPVTVSNGAMASDIQKKDAVDVSSSCQSQQAVDFGKVELQMVVRDLRALALNPTHGHGRDCPSVIRQVFLKYRSLVYQKSLSLSPPPENEANEGNSSILPATTVTAQKINNKIIKPSARLDDPTRGGRKRAPSDNLENIKKKKKTDGVAQEIKKKKKTDDVSQEIKKKKKTDDVSQEIKLKKKTDDEIKKRKSDAIEEIWKKKKLDDSKLTKVPQRSTDSHLAKNVHAVKVESSKKMMQNVKGGANPTMLVMKFPEGAALPSGAELRAKFARFGPLDHSATRVFWKSYTCRLVYHHRIDAEAALNFANGSSNLFGNTNVRSYVREVEGAAESEPMKMQVQKEESDRIAAAAQHIQNVEQLKSCLKKSEGGNGGGRGGTRVKFVLESNIEGEKLHFSTSEISSNSNSNSNNKNKNIEVLDMNNKTNLAKLKSSINIEQGSTRFKQQPINDISQEMLNLLMRCSDLVNNLTGVLGYVPYHSL